VNQSSVLLAKAFSQKNKEFACWESFAVAWSKACTNSKPLFSVQSLAGADKLPEWLLFNFLTLA